MIINIEASLIYFCMLFSTVIITPIFYYVYRITRDIVASYCQRQFVNQCAKIFKENEAIVKHTVYSILDIVSNVENHTNNYLNNSLLYKAIGLSCEKIVDIFKTYISNYNTSDLYNYTPDLYNNTINPINNASIYDHIDGNMNTLKPTTPIYCSTTCNPVGDYCVQTHNYSETPVLTPLTCEKTVDKISELNKRYIRSKNRSNYRNRRIRFRPFESRKKTVNDSILDTPISEVSDILSINSPQTENNIQNTIDNTIDNYYSKCIDTIDLVGINPNCQDEYKNKLKNCLDMLKNPETNPSDYINHVMESFGFDKKDASVQSLLKIYGLDKYASDSETNNANDSVSDNVSDNVSEYIDEISDKVTIESEESDNE
ncbi:hypothetical protein LBA_00401 [Megavirus lba]|uniref:Uncharacterized protein n=1 Tax=Megavirus lba TaxID=1235314 RepID=L7Y3H2_9VIRU|nr:hypothetical protein LBA_00401 [Megavirus lba]